MNYCFYDTINRINFSIKNNKKYLFLDNNKLNFIIIIMMIKLNIIIRYKIYNRRILLVINNSLNIFFSFYSKLSHRKFLSIYNIKKLGIINGIINTNKGIMLLSRAYGYNIGGELLCTY